MDIHITARREERLGHLVLNRSQALNALSLSMVRTLYRTLSDWQADPTVHAVMLRSGSPQAFCAGGDLRFFYEACHADLHGGRQAVEDFFTEEYRLNHLIYHYPKPWLVLMDGIVMGGGMGIAQGGASCVRVVSERARMAMPEANIGLFPDVGGGHFLSRLPDQLGVYLALSGESICAADAVQIGLADFLVPSAQMPALAAALQAVDDDGYRACVAALAAMHAPLPAPEDSITTHRAAIARHFAHDSIAAIADSLRQDDSPFAHRTLASMAQRSPLMLCVTLKQLRMAQNRSLANCLRMERTMVRHCFEHGEVMEGIRAAIIDKDRQPRWQPANIEQVSDEMVERFFEPVWPAHLHPLRDLV